MRLALNFPDLAEADAQKFYQKFEKIDLNAKCLLLFLPSLSPEQSANTPQQFIPINDAFPYLHCSVFPFYGVC